MLLNGKNLKMVLVDNMSHLIISKKNEVYLHIKADPHVYYELKDQFTFEVPGAKYMPQYKNRYWDGRIYLFNVNTGEIYVGLLDKIIKFCSDHKYTYEFQNNKFYGLPFEVNKNISKEGVKDYINSINKYSPRDYQVDGVYDALKYNRKLLISPTASGKSLMIYSLVRYFVEKDNNILIIVPTISLVEQLYKDFEDYGWDVGSFCHKIYAGKERNTDSQIIITTWQSIYKLPRKYFSRFNAVIGDECLHPDTLISMANGDKKAIKELTIGEEVLTFNEYSKLIEPKKIKKVHKNISVNEQLYKLNLSDGSHIKITGNHKVLLKSGIWKRVDELSSGDVINSIN